MQLLKEFFDLGLKCGDACQRDIEFTPKPNTFGANWAWFRGVLRAHGPSRYRFCLNCLGGISKIGASPGLNGYELPTDSNSLERKTLCSRGSRC